MAVRRIVYPTLAKPNLLHGIPRLWLFGAALPALWTWPPTQNIFVPFGLYLLLLVVGWFWAKLDPDFVDVYLAKARLGRAKGYTAWSGNEYLS